MTIFRSRPKGVHGRRTGWFSSFSWYVVAAVACIMLMFAPYYLVRELSGGAQPTGEQLRAARALIGVIILVPFAVLVGRMWWEGRGAEVEWTKRRTESRVDDHSKESRIDETLRRRNSGSDSAI